MNTPQPRQRPCNKPHVPLVIAALALGQTSDLDAKIAAVLPTANEDRWLQIPWRQDLGAALKEAEQKKKPLYLWVMDGNPLGCT